MSVRRHRHLGLWIVALALARASLVAQVREVSTVELQGAWKELGQEHLIKIQDQEFLTIEKGKLHIRGIVHYRAGSLVLRNWGVLETWQVELNDGGRLRLSHGNETHDYGRLLGVAPSLEFHPVALGAERPLPSERVKVIQKEIADRFAHDQAVRKKPGGAPATPAPAPDNHSYLLQLLREVGCIDTARFGVKSSVYATILVKHTEDLSMMVAVLPCVERDLKNSGEGQTYAVLFDGVQLDLGRKQRYGTQIDEDAKGNPYILPLEDPARVDEYLRAIGLPPLSKYLADASAALYNGRPIRLATAEESD